MIQGHRLLYGRAKSSTRCWLPCHESYPGEKIRIRRQPADWQSARTINPKLQLRKLLPWYDHAVEFLPNLPTSSPCHLCGLPFSRIICYTNALLAPLIACILDCEEFPPAGCDVTTSRFSAGAFRKREGISSWIVSGRLIFLPVCIARDVSPVATSKVDCSFSHCGWYILQGLGASYFV